MTRKKVVVIGGGTGTFTVLSGLKKYSDKIEISAVVSMMDSGGSNRIIRDEFGLLPTSDIRQCILALSSDNSDEILRKLFNYRYTQGTGISGMTFGNLFMAALTDIYSGDQEKAIQETSKILDVSGQVIPVTLDSSQLVATYDNGIQVLGEHFIDEPNEKTNYHRITNLEVFPKAKANKNALKAILGADLIILGPGDLYTSVLCDVVVDRVAESIRKSKAKKVFIMNLMTRFGQTDGFSASDHLAEMEKFLGGKVFDFCLVNKKDTIPAKAVAWYKKNDAAPVKDDLGEDGKLKVVRGNYVSSKFYQKSASDKLVRSLIRHDSKKVAKAIVDLLVTRQS
jgi:uncharacterized cofD-like protein